MNAKQIADSVTSLHDDAFLVGPRRIHTDAIMVNALSERVFKALVLFVCGWSLIEAPLELGVSSAHTGLLALFVSKLVVVGIGLAAIAQTRVARAAFVFICAASVLAIAPAISMEFRQSFAIAMFSMVECFSKAACVIAFGFASSRGKQSRQP